MLQLFRSGMRYSQMAKKVALINMKGGVGKSTHCVNLAWHFALVPDNKQVLVVDLDPQFNASQYLLGNLQYEQIPQGRHSYSLGYFRTATGVISPKVDPRTNNNASNATLLKRGINNRV